MKKLLLIIVVVWSTQSKAQFDFQIGGTQGVTTSQISGDAHAGFHKYGITGGLLIRGVVNKVFATQLEIIYKEKGSRYYPPPEADTSSNPFWTPPTYGYFLQLNYLELPLLFQYNYPDIKGLTFETGVGLGFLLKSVEYVTEPGYNREQYGPPFKYKEVSYNVGVAYTLSSGFGFAARFSRSITPARDYHKGEVTTPLKTGQQNTVLSLSIIYHYTVN